MVLIHDSMHRGHTRQGWLDSFHTFSFGGFSDPTRMGYGALRVINEDRIIPGSGFSAHGHDNMDILTLPLTGALRHADTLGNSTVIRPGEAQLMSAGSGIRHEEMNASVDGTTHFLQIWIIPEEFDGKPTYQQITLPEAARGWTRFADRNGGEGILKLISDTKIAVASPLEGDRLAVTPKLGRQHFVQIVEGLATLEGERLNAGTGLQIGTEEIGPIEWVTGGRALLFDLKQ
ncbi:pirin family protein [Martelella alba]|uniref:Pirin family protein n=1 Tax=Martelella alba TaxID=2590451 RepID=A0A506U589_9HYPH|nr:pirin-like bicupin family protein [Martelella alba]TPW27087.1 pirin family protein [Martelella alba]